MDRRLYVHIQGGRAVSGVLRGFDIFLNLVIDQAFEELGAGERKPAGMVVSDDGVPPNPQVIRGNSVTSMELLDSMRV